jgi:enoyl-CoA hydratase/carnithine racemase
MQHSVCSRYVHQTLEHVLQKFAIIFKEHRYLVGVGLIPSHVPLSEVEHAHHIAGFLWRKAKDLGEGIVLQRRDDAVGLGHLGAEGNYSDGEGNLLLRFPAVAVKAQHTRKTIQQTAACVADGRRQTRDPLPHRHGRAIVPFRPQRLRRGDRMGNPELAQIVKATPMQVPATDEVLIRREGRAGRLTMNRPQALNALTLGMVRQIWSALLTWRSDPAVELVVLDGTGERALCAGGDVRALYDSRSNGSSLARSFWREEYRLNALIGRYPKPFLAIQDGIVMGGGIGLSGHAAHRIVTERSRLAMPETGIGLIPDVGGTWLLSRAPTAVGVYLGLTGEAMRAADAIFARLADVFVASPAIGRVVDRLVDPSGGSVGDIISSVASDPGPSLLANRRADIDQVFGADTVEAMLSALSAAPGAWAQNTAATLAQKSPKSLKLTLAAIRNARDLTSLEHALNVEFRLCVRLFEDGEFIEGVRALIVEKDRQPKWSPVRLQDVARELIAAYVAPLPPQEELGLEPSQG